MCLSCAESPPPSEISEILIAEILIDFKLSEKNFLIGSLPQNRRDLPRRRGDVSLQAARPRHFV